MSTCKVLLTDFKRMLTGYNFCMAVVGVFLSFVFSREKELVINNSTLLTYVNSTMRSGSLVAFIFCALPYSQVFCEDLEHKYLFYQLIRGSLSRYVFAKIIVIFFSAILAMVLGSALFIGLLLTQAPMVDSAGAMDEFLLRGTYAVLLENRYYMSYCLVYAMNFGMLAGILSVLAAFLSLYISNRMMVLIIPVLITQILADFQTDKYGFGILSYRLYHKSFDTDWQTGLFLGVVTIGIIFCIAVGIYRKLRKRI